MRRARTWWLVGLTLFGLIMALGSHTFLYLWLKKLLPALGLARYPVKFVTLAAFAVPLLAAFAIAGFQQSSTAQRPGRSLIITGAVVFGVMAGLLWIAHAYPFRFDQWTATFENTLWRITFLILVVALVWLSSSASVIPERWRHWLGMALLGVIALDAATHSPRQNPTLPSSVFAPHLWQQAFHTQPPQFGASRIMISPPAEEALLHSRVENPQDNFLGRRLAEWSNLNVLDDIPKVNGSSTLQLSAQMQMQKMLYASTNRLLNGLMDYLGVSEYSASNQVVEWAARTNYLPLVTAGQRPVFVEGTNALAALAAPDFDPREVVYLPTEAEPQVAPREKTLARIVSTNITAQRIEFEVEAREASLVTIAQSYYHPWEAEVDGRPVPLWQANYVFQAVQVAEGRHTVVLRYYDRNFRAGAAVSLATLLGCLLYWMRRRRLSAA